MKEEDFIVQCQEKNGRIIRNSFFRSKMQILKCALLEKVKILDEFA